MAGRSRRLTAIVLSVIIISVVTPAPVHASRTEAPDNSDDGFWNKQATDRPINNSTARHRNPDNTSSQGDLIGVRGWLSDRLAGQLEESAVKINQREYEAGRSLVGDQYDSRLAQLVDVVGETETENDDTTDETFGETRDTQRNLSNTAEEYDRTYESYQQAVRAGNETAARRQARRLERLEDRIQRQNRTLAENYERLGNQTGADVTEAVDSIRNLSRNISTRQAQVRQEAFTETTLEITTAAETISYDNPLVARGRLVTENGTAVSDRTVNIRVHTRSRTVQTDEDGRFSFEYRPRTIRVNRSDLSVVYVPQNESVYVGSGTTVPVDIRQVEATLAVRSGPSTVGFGDRVTVTTTLTRNGDPVSGVPVSTSVGRFVLGEQRTDDSGVRTLAGRLPASVRPGQRRMTVTVAQQGRAVTAPDTSTAFTVQSTETSITVSGEQTSRDDARITGRLRTIDGIPIPGQQVRVTVGDGVGRAVETGENGTYSLVVDRSAISSGEDVNASLSAGFDGQGTNLRSTTATDVIELGSAGQGEPGSAGQGELGPENVPDTPSLLLISVVVLGGLVVLFRQYRASSSTESEDTEHSVGDQSNNVPPNTTQSLDLSHGRSLLADNRPNAAVQYAYHRVRGSLEQSIDVRDTDTHWEFFYKCRQGDLDQDELAPLQTLVEAYEQVQFHDEKNPDLDLGSLFENIEETS